VHPAIVIAALQPSLPEGAGWVGQWTPGIGDPTFLGWFTVVAYFAATLACFRLRSRFSSDADSVRRKERCFWGGMTASLLFLCINKQLDLQSAMTEFLRTCAKREGWYEIRYKFQVAFIAAMAVSLPVCSLALLLVARKLPISSKFAGLGLIIIAVFVLVRAASFHHIDRLLGARVLHFKLNWILELGGISIVLVGARKRWQQLNKGTYAR
jgi:hypothetical protein